MSAIRKLVAAAAVALCTMATAVVTAAPANAQQSQADVSIDLTARSAFLSQSVTLTVVIRNAGPAASTPDGRLLFEWPRAYALGNPVIPSDCQPDDGPTIKAVICTPGVLAPGASRTFRVVIPVPLLTNNEAMRFDGRTIFYLPFETNSANNYDNVSCRAMTSLLISC